MQKNDKFTLIAKIFREIKSLITSLVKTLLPRNFRHKSVRVNFCNFYTVQNNLFFTNSFTLMLGDNHQHHKLFSRKKILRINI